MADNSSDVKSGSRSSSLTGMIALLLLLIMGFVGNSYLNNIGSGARVSHVEHANQLKVISQEIAKHAVSASQGNANGFGSLANQKSEFESHLNALKNGGANAPSAPAAAQARVSEVSDLWEDMSAQVDVILTNRDALIYLKETSE